MEKIEQVKNTSTSIRTIKQIVNEYDSKLLATDKRFRKSVKIIHDDGTVMCIDSAFLMTHGDYVIVFSEHHSSYIYHREDLIWYGQFKRLYDKIEELK